MTQAPLALTFHPTDPYAAASSSHCQWRRCRTLTWTCLHAELRLAVQAHRRRGTLAGQSTPGGSNSLRGAPRPVRADLLSYQCTADPEIGWIQWSRPCGAEQLNKEVHCSGHGIPYSFVLILSSFAVVTFEYNFWGNLYLMYLLPRLAVCREPSLYLSGWRDTRLPFGGC
jgi:hypothetical protein